MKKTSDSAGGGRGDGGKGRGDGGKGKRSSNTTNISSACVLKFLAPEPLAAAIIGKGGTTISEMRQTCQAKITLTEHGKVYPQTDARIITVQADAEQPLNEVSRQIIAKLVETQSSASEAVGQDGELKLRTLVPRAAVGGIIGKGGASIKQIRESSGAKIQITDATNSSPASEQLVTIEGTEEALEYVMKEVNRQIQMLNGEAWFAVWAASTGVVGPSSASAPYAGVDMSSQPLTMSMPMRGGGANPAGIDLMMRVANNLPPYVMEDSRGFALSCVVPNSLVGGIIGRGGAGTKEVQNITGTKIGIREIPDDPDNRSLNIAGPLANTCAAYMLMMKRYLDVEAQSAQTRGPQHPR